MSAAQIHPEDLLDRARRGSLGADERRLLDRHLARCPACRLELSISPALYTRIELGAEDHALIDRAVANASRGRRFGRRRFSLRGVRAAVLVAAALAVAAMASAGAYAWRRTVARIEAPALARPSETSGAATRMAEGPRVLEVPKTLAPAETAVEAPAGPTSSINPRSRVLADAARRSDDGRRSAESTACAERFRKANELRRAGAAADAVRLYHELGAACAGSSEELSSRVLVGRIYLDRLGDPSRALAAFDAYLAATANGALREDAMIGRALALGRLGRPVDEANAWQALLSAYPDSLYAEKARSRLNRPK